MPTRRESPNGDGKRQPSNIYTVPFQVMYNHGICESKFRAPPHQRSSSLPSARFQANDGFARQGLRPALHGRPLLHQRRRKRADVAETVELGGLRWHGACRRGEFLMPSAFCAVSRSGPIAEPPRPRTPTTTHTQRRVLPCSGRSWKIHRTFELLASLFQNEQFKISSKSRSRSSRSSAKSSSCREQPPRVQC